MSFGHLAIAGVRLSVGGLVDVSAYSGQSVVFDVAVSPDVEGMSSGVTQVQLMQMVGGQFVDIPVYINVAVDGYGSLSLVVQGNAGEVFSYRVRTFNPNYSAILSNVVAVTLVQPVQGQPTVQRSTAQGNMILILGLGALAVIGYFLLKKK